MDRKASPPPRPAGIDDCDQKALLRWEESKFAIAPYQFKDEHCVIEDHGLIRVPNADERERLHGFRTGHTRGYPEGTHKSFLGNTFHCVVIALLMGQWACGTGYVDQVPTVEDRCMLF